MAIPDYQSLMLPLLQLAADGGLHTRKEAVEALSTSFSLSQEERSQLLPSGKQALMTSRVGWAVSYLKMADLLIYPKRGVFQITAEGTALIQKKDITLNVKFLQTLPAYQNHAASTCKEALNKTEIGTTEESVLSPDETIDQAYGQIRAALEMELLERIKSCSSGFFEGLVIELLLAMGYGGSQEDAGEIRGKSHDGGLMA